MPLFGRKKSELEIKQKVFVKQFEKILHKDAIAEVLKNLMPDEQVNIIIKGLWDSAIIVTQYRIFIYYKRGMMGGVTGGSKLISWDLGSVHGVQMEFGKLTGFITLQTPNAAVADTSYWARDATSPQKAPNAIAINKDLRKQADTGVIALRTLLFQSRSAHTPR